MNNSVRKRTDCRLCGSKSLELAIPVRACPVGDAYVTRDQLSEKQELYPMDLFLCMDCAHLQLPYIVNPDLLFSNYTYKTSSSPGLVSHFGRYCTEVVKKLDLSAPGLVVEIGSNDGSLLKCFKGLGFKTIGIDPAKSIAAEATKNGIETLSRFFSEEVADQIVSDAGRASLVCANNVYAHADDMTGITRGIEKLLAKDGVFVFEVSYLVDMVERKVFDTIYHEHLCHHSIKPLDAFLKLNGMVLFDIDRIASKGGSIRCFAQRKDGPRAVSKTIHEYIESENRLGYHQLGVYSNFARSLENLREDLHLFLDAARSKGKKIAGFGASNPITTIIFHLELGNYLSHLFDDNPVKQGTFSPYLHIPVLPTEQIYEVKPDYIVLLAWAYADRVLQKHEKFCKNLNGRFIVPIPEMRVLS